MSGTPGFSFDVSHTDGHARRGRLVTPHGDGGDADLHARGHAGEREDALAGRGRRTGARSSSATPTTCGCAPAPRSSRASAASTAFTRWPHAMLTDSGGFQAFSLAPEEGRRETGDRQRRRRTSLVKLDEEGFMFRSHLDGSRCTSLAGGGGGGAGAHRRRHPHAARRLPAGRLRPRDGRRGGRRADDALGEARLAAPRAEEQALFGIVQGACFPICAAPTPRSSARRLPASTASRSAASPSASPSRGCTRRSPRSRTALDPARPRYLMGVGTPRDLARGIDAGVDMFDCVLPTRNARNGQALTRRGRVVIKQARYREDDPRRSIRPARCPPARGGYSRAYLRHLYLAGEILVLRLFSLHNLHLYGELVAGAREAIAARHIRGVPALVPRLRDRCGERCARA